MAESNDMALGYALGQDSNNGCNNGAMGRSEERRVGKEC